MDCSKAGFPSLTVAVKPRLRDQIESRESLNGKVAFSIRCEMNNTVKFMNRSAVVSESSGCQRMPQRESCVLTLVHRVLVVFFALFVHVYTLSL